MNKIIYCDACGEEIRDLSTCKMYPSGGPHYDTIYICKECSSDKPLNDTLSDYDDSLEHVDMNGEPL
jgi:hypothetical protein